MKKIRINEALFEGIVSLENLDNGWVQPWRLPHREQALFADCLLGKAKNASGCRLRFATNSRSIRLACCPNDPGLPEDRKTLCDLTIDGALIQTAELDKAAACFSFENLPAGEKTVEIWLPVAYQFYFNDLSVDDGAFVRSMPDPRRKWITYGSSISHCSNAHSPARTWPAIAARARNLNLTSLGFSGDCHLDPMVARVIRDLPADFISLKVGVNIMGQSSLSPRTFKGAVIGFVQIIREKHAEIPIALISPIISPTRETADNAVGLSLVKMRSEVADAARRIRETCGDENLHYFNGLDLFGEDLLGDRLPDNLHPDGDGYEILGRNFVRVVLGRLGI